MGSRSLYELTSGSLRPEEGGAGGGIYADCYTANQTTVNIQAGEITGNSRYGVVYHSSTVNYSKTGGNIINNTPNNILAW